MGQLVGVVEKPSSAPGIVRFELNRSLSGMGHERFSSVLDAAGPQPSASLARELFATGKVAWVHVYGNTVTVDIEKGYDSSGLSDIVEEMYRYWKPGVVPPEFDDLPVEEPAAVDDGAMADDPAMAAAAKLVPGHLLERGKAARERWNATQG